MVVAHGRGQLLQRSILGHVNKQRPAVLGRQAHDVDNLLHLVTLERHRLFGVHLGLLAFEDGPQAQQLGKDAPEGPHVDGGRVVARPEQQFRRAVPDGHDDLVARVQRVQRLVEHAREAQVADFDLARRRDHDVGGLEVAVQHPLRVQVLAAVEQLEHDALDGGGRDRVARLLGVVVDDLQQVVLGVLKHHIYALVLEDDLGQFDDVGVREFRAQCHLAHRRLRDARVGEGLAFFVGLELLDGEFARLRVGGQPANGFVYTSISTGGDEADYLVPVDDTHFGLVADGPKGTAIGGVWGRKISLVCFISLPFFVGRPFL